MRERLAPFLTQEVKFGHPEFWSRVVDEYPRFFAVHPRLVQSFNSLSQKPRPTLSLQEKVVLNLALLAGVAMEELVTLASNGLGMGAMKIARNLLELSINAEYLRMNETAVEDYVEWFWVEQHKLFTYAREYDTTLLNRFSPETIASTEADFSRVRSRFAKPHNSRELRRDWCSVSLEERARQTEFQLPYRLINPIGSRLLHGTSGALLDHFDVGVSTEQIAAPPSLKLTRQALCGGHCCVAMVIHTLAVLFVEEGIPSSTQIASDFQTAWNVQETPI